jgi:hypothetical protein
VNPPGPLQHRQLNTPVLLKKILQQSVFAFFEDFVSVEIANEFEAGFYKFARFFFRVSYDGDEVVIFEAYELRV